MYTNRKRSMLIVVRAKRLPWMDKLRKANEKMHPVSPVGQYPGMVCKDPYANDNITVRRSAHDRFKINSSLGFSRRLGRLQNAAMTARFMVVITMTNIGKTMA